MRTRMGITALPSPNGVCRTAPFGRFSACIIAKLAQRTMSTFHEFCLIRTETRRKWCGSALSMILDIANPASNLFADICNNFRNSKVAFIWKEFERIAHADQDDRCIDMLRCGKKMGEFLCMGGILRSSYCRKPADKFSKYPFA